MRYISFSLALVLCMASPVLAHEGEDHAAAPGTESGAGAITGPIEVSEPRRQRSQSRRNWRLGGNR